MEETSLAAPTPSPIATPTCADAKAAASLIPSPTIATMFSSFCSALTNFFFSPGLTPAKTYPPQNIRNINSHMEFYHVTNTKYINLRSTFRGATFIVHTSTNQLGLRIASKFHILKSDCVVLTTLHLEFFYREPGNWSTLLPENDTCLNLQLVRRMSSFASRIFPNTRLPVKFPLHLDLDPFISGKHILIYSICS